jgi:hypothetical protein
MLKRITDWIKSWFVTDYGGDFDDPDGQYKAYMAMLTAGNEFRKAISHVELDQWPMPNSVYSNNVSNTVPTVTQEVKTKKEFWEEFDNMFKEFMPDYKVSHKVYGWDEDETYNYLKNGVLPKRKLPDKDHDIQRFEGEGGPAHD